MRTHPGEQPSGSLIKENLASGLKQAIMDGRLGRGHRVIEGRWAKEFGAAKASVREAINLLIAEGYLVKDAGRSARGVNYREQDVAHLYQVRSALEGLAAELACINGADLTGLESAFERMFRATESNDMKALLQSDVGFHLALIESAGNPVLAELGRKLLFPLFAFVQIQVLNTGQGPQAWLDDLPQHDLIVQVIREGNPALAGQFVRHCVNRFARSAYAVWRNVGGSVEAHNKSQQSRSRKVKSSHD